MGKILIDEATVKLALEALGQLWLFSDEAAVIANPAITALRKALAEQPSAVEGNGGMTGWPPGLLQDDCKGLSKWLSKQPDARRRVREALAEQPAQRTWVGLTDDEIDTAIGFVGSFGARQDARNIEAKLKEKNT